MTTQERLQKVMRSVFFNDQLDIEPHMTALDVDGWDSLSHSMLLLDVEQEFSVELDIARVSACRDIGELIHYIDSLAPNH
jgi:acyl carrier protein